MVFLMDAAMVDLMASRMAELMVALRVVSKVVEMDGTMAAGMV